MIAHHRHRVTGLLILLLLLLLFVGCPYAGRNRLPGHLYLRLNTNPTTLDPALITDVMGGLIAAKLFNGLVRFNDNLDVVPDVAESWSISADHRTYTFLLRKDARFSTGRRVTAGDVRYSFERVLDPGTRAPFTWVLDRIRGARDVLSGRARHAKGIRVLDDRRIAITLDRPFGPFLSLLGMTTAYIVPREAVERAGADFGSHPTGSGPYVLAEWLPSRSLRLEARNDYFGGRPRLKGIVYRVIPEDLTAVMEFETGGLDALQIPASEHRRYTTDPKWRGRVYSRPGLNCYYLGMNCRRPPFNDVRVRRAMNLAIDRKRILDTVFEKRGVLAIGPIPPQLWKYVGPPAASEGYPYDPAEARRLIRAAGAEGRHISLYISADPEVLDIVEVIADYLKKAGIDVGIVQLDWSAFKETLNKGEADAFWLSWWADYPDPEDFLFPLFDSANFGAAGNRTWYRDTFVDATIERAQRTVDERKRERLYRRADDRIIRDAPWVFMWHRSDFYVVSERVRHFVIHPIYSIDKGMEIGLAD